MYLKGFFLGGGGGSSALNSEAKAVYFWCIFRLRLRLGLRIGFDQSSSRPLFCRVAAHDSARHRKLSRDSALNRGASWVRAGALSRWVTGALWERLVRSHWGQQSRVFPIPKLVSCQPQVLFRGMTQSAEEKRDWSWLQLNTLKFVGFFRRVCEGRRLNERANRHYW